MALAERPISSVVFGDPLSPPSRRDQWLTEGGQSAFGAAIDQLLRLHPAFSAFAAQAGGTALELLERDLVRRAGGLSEAALFAEGVHVLPEFLGNRTPYADPAARAAIVGLDLRDDLESLQELYAGGLCGLAYGIADVIGVLERGGYAFDMIVVSGGAARSLLVRQIVADATGKTVCAPQTREPVLLGSAMIGAVAAGRRTIGEAMTTMSSLAQTFAPCRGRNRGVSRAQASRVRNPTAGRARHSRPDASRRLGRAKRLGEPSAASRRGRRSSSSTATACWSTARFSRLARRGARSARRACISATRKRAIVISVLRLDSPMSKVEAELRPPLPAEFPDDLSRDILASFSRELKGIAGVRQAVEGGSRRGPRGLLEFARAV